MKAARYTILIPVLKQATVTDCQQNAKDDLRAWYLCNDESSTADKTFAAKHILVIRKDHVMDTWLHDSAHFINS
jgi:hypothetical protein